MAANAKSMFINISKTVHLMEYYFFRTEHIPILYSIYVSAHYDES